eukprot:269576-Chlamydomonas_euryale.AAC.3
MLVKGWSKARQRLVKGWSKGPLTSTDKVHAAFVETVLHHITCRSLACPSLPAVRLPARSSLPFACLPVPPC